MNILKDGLPRRELTLSPALKKPVPRFAERYSCLFDPCLVKHDYGYLDTEVYSEVTFGQYSGPT